MMKAARDDSAGLFQRRNLPWVLLFAGALACDSTGGSGAHEAGASGVLGGEAGVDAETDEVDDVFTEAVDINTGGEDLDAGAQSRGAGDESPDAEEESIDAGEEALDADAPAEDAEVTAEADAQLGEPDAGDGAAPDAGSPVLEAGADTAVTTPAPPKLCVEHCAADQDCWEAEFGFESCVEGRCTSACASHDECSDKGAQGRRACTVDANCAANQVCVALGNGDQRCAKSRALAACTSREWPRTRTHVESGAPIEVCMTSLRCSPQGCVTPCTGQCDASGVPRSCDATSGLCVCLTDADCGGMPNAPRCDVAAGRCVCGGDADCTDPRLSHCDAETGTCQCTTDEQCGAGAVCRAGACVQTCEEASTCAQVLPATTVSCE